MVNKFIQVTTIDGDVIIIQLDEVHRFHWDKTSNKVYVYWKLPIEDKKEETLQWYAQELRTDMKTIKDSLIKLGVL